MVFFNDTFKILQVVVSSFILFIPKSSVTIVLLKLFSKSISKCQLQFSHKFNSAICIFSFFEVYFSTKSNHVDNQKNIEKSKAIHQIL
jgi:hypothetical protein